MPNNRRKDKGKGKISEADCVRSQRYLNNIRESKAKIAQYEAELAMLQERKRQLKETQKQAIEDLNKMKSIFVDNGVELAKVLEVGELKKWSADTSRDIAYEKGNKQLEKAIAEGKYFKKFKKMGLSVKVIDNLEDYFEE